MGVSVEHDRHGGVARKLLDELRVYVPLEEERGAGVSKVMEGDGGSPARAKSGAKDHWRRLEGLMRLPISPAKTRPRSW